MSDTPLNRTFTDKLDSHGTLRARAHQGLTREPLADRSGGSLRYWDISIYS
jgi:hypothetical protein